jgi:hypothetical protein
MKKFSIASFVTVFIFAVALSFHTNVFAAATVPASSVWITPATAVAGSAVTVNALVYNSQSQTATVTVVFSFDRGTIGTVVETISPDSARTAMQSWLMPSNATVVTAAVTAAYNNEKQSIPSLVGTIGTVTIGIAPVPVISSVTFPGSAQLSAWFGPVIAKIETFRINEAAYYAQLRDATKASINVTSPTQSFTLIYASAFASFFGNQVLFYIAMALLILILLRFIVNLIF